MSLVPGKNVLGGGSFSENSEQWLRVLVGNSSQSMKYLESQGINELPDVVSSSKAARQNVYSSGPRLVVVAALGTKKIRRVPVRVVLLVMRSLLFVVVWRKNGFWLVAFTQQVKANSL